MHFTLTGRILSLLEFISVDEENHREQGGQSQYTELPKEQAGGGGPGLNRLTIVFVRSFDFFNQSGRGPEPSLYSCRASP